MQALSPHPAPRLLLNGIDVSDDTPVIVGIEASDFFVSQGSDWIFESGPTHQPNREQEDPILEIESEEDGLARSTRTLEVVHRIRDAIDGNIVPLDEVKVCASLLAGTDASVVELLPKTPLFVGIDAHRFLPVPFADKDMRRYRKTLVPQHWYVTSVNRVSSEKGVSVASSLLGTLSFLLPDFRLRRVLSFSSYEKFDGRVAAFLKKHVTTLPEADFDGWTQLVHGLIEFDTGPDTPVRQYLHVNDVFDNAGEFRDHWWFRSLSQDLVPQAVLCKGAMGVFSDDASFAAPRAKAVVLDLMRRHGSVLLEDTKAGTLSGEFSGERFLGSPRIEVPTQNVFGYGDHFRITRVRPQE